MKKTRVYLLDGGSLVVDGFHILWNRGPGGEVRIPCYTVLVDHEEGRFLFDSGFDLAHVNRVLPFEKPLQSADQTIAAQLATLGLRPSDITHVINSHLHFDHCGANRHFSRAVVVCHELELRAASYPQPFELLGYSDLSFSSEVERIRRPAAATDASDQADQGHDSYSPVFQLITGDVELAQGVNLFETPGHTAGHYSLMVELEDRRPILFTSDACYGPKNLELNCVPGFHLDPVKGIQSLERLRRLAAEHDAELFFSHDQPSYESYRRAPDFYS